MITLIKPNGTKIIIKEKFNMNMANKHIGGWILPYRLDENNWFLMDEDGDPKELPINKEATEIFKKVYEGKLNFDHIRGNVIITDEFK